MIFSVVVVQKVGFLEAPFSDLLKQLSPKLLVLTVPKTSLASQIFWVFSFFLLYILLA